VILGISGHPGFHRKGAAVLVAVLAAMAAGAAAPQAQAAPTCSVEMIEPNQGPNTWDVELGETAGLSVSCLGATGIEAVEGPGRGSLALVPQVSPMHAMFRYTAPDAGPLGTVTIRFEGRDAFGTTPITVSLNLVGAVNEAPRCSVLFLSIPTPPLPSDPWELEAGDVVHPSMFCLDDEGDPLSFAIENHPGQGQLQILQTFRQGAEAWIASLRYRPDPGGLGIDSFSIRATDDHQGSHVVQVLVDLEEGTDEAPVCLGGRFGTGLNEPLELPGLAIACSDPEGGPLQFVLGTPPAHGQITPPDGQGRASYVPDDGYAGPDSFTYRASDGVNQSNEAVVHIAVAVPTCADVPLTTVRGAALALGGGCTDPDGDELTLSLVDPPQHGDIVGPDGQGRLWYLPDPDSDADSDFFTYQANDGTHDSNVGRVDITFVEPGLPIPSCRISSATVRQGAELTGTLVCGGENISYEPVAGPLHGTLTGPDAGGRFRYVPDPGYMGPDFFVYQARGAFTGIESGVLIEVAAADGSGHQAVSADVPGGAAIGTGAEATGADPLVASVTTPTTGTVSIAEGPATGGPPAGYEFLGHQVQIAAPDASAADPLRLTFTLDSSALPTGVGEHDLQVFRDGTLVPACDPSAGGAASPDPCVAARERLGAGDVRLTVLTSRASTWNLGRAATSGGGGTGGGTGDPGTGGAGAGDPGTGGGGTAGGATGGAGGAGASAGATPVSGGGAGEPPAGPKTAPCRGLSGKALSRCRLDRQVARKCRGLKRARRTVCARRIRALAKCNAIKARTAGQRQRKARCIRRARAIGGRRP
jgi:hypothetical protein